MSQVGASRHGPPPGDVEVQPRVRSVSAPAVAAERRHQPPRRTSRPVPLADVGDLHGSESIGGGQLRVRSCEDPPMSRLQTKSIGAPDELRQFPNGQLEIYGMDDVVIGRTLFEPGWRWSVNVKPIAGTPSASTTILASEFVVALGSGPTTGRRWRWVPAWSSTSLPDMTAGSSATSRGRPTTSPGCGRSGRTIDPDDRIPGVVPLHGCRRLDRHGRTVGDARWRETISTLNELCQAEVDRLRGRISRRPATASSRSSTAPSGRSGRLSLRRHRHLRSDVALRAGVHTGEVELSSGDVRGLAVHVASRIMGLAGGGEVYVSGTTYELIAGSSLAFEDRGEHELKGVSGRRRAYQVVRPPADVRVSRRSARLEDHEPDEDHQAERPTPPRMSGTRESR